ncbi:MAG: NADP-dependent malic enzyme [Candidatus Aenigmarchaeota archaeon]|nr:NADP-dependent malic enzyme [Candidatus Aenigmarchaeota archaeon]
MGLKEDALDIHRKLKGKLEVNSKTPVKDMKILSLLYTPGVAEVSREIFNDREKVYEYTSKQNSVAIVTDGTRVLGLGDIGPEAAMPVMEGKSVIFKLFGNVDSFPICLGTKDAEEIVNIVKNISPTFGAINIEDIDSPKCFGIVDRLNEELDIPVFHDDQQGTGIVVLAALINSMKVVKKDIRKARIVIMGAGSAGIGTAKMLLSFGATNLLLLDSKGIVYEGRSGLDKYKEELARRTNKEKMKGGIEEAINGADVFIGVSGRSNILTGGMVRKMSRDAVVFALSNPDPEISPEEAKKGGARIIATGRSDFHNQINNSLVFPGVLRGVLDVRAKKINEKMMLGAALTLAGIAEKNLSEDYILPKTTDMDVHRKIAANISKTAAETGVARIRK